MLPDDLDCPLAPLSAVGRKDATPSNVHGGCLTNNQCVSVQFDFVCAESVNNKVPLSIPFLWIYQIKSLVAYTILVLYILLGITNIIVSGQVNCY
jgi:hypothetical protein